MKDFKPGEDIFVINKSNDVWSLVNEEPSRISPIQFVAPPFYTLCGVDCTPASTWGEEFLFRTVEEANAECARLNAVSYYPSTPLEASKDIDEMRGIPEGLKEVLEKHKDKAIFPDQIVKETIEYCLNNADFISAVATIRRLHGDDAFPVDKVYNHYLKTKK